MLQRAYFLVLLLVALVPLCSGTAQGRAGRWTRAGNTDGAGSQPIPSQRMPPDEAWSQRLSGRLESEPLVWDRNLLLALRDAAGRRSLVWMDLPSGRRLASQNLASSEPLAPALYGDRIAVRIDGRRVDLLRVAGARFQLLRSFGGEAPVSAPLLAEGVLYLRVGDELRAYSLDRKQPLWRLGGKVTFRGTPSLARGVLFAVYYDERANASLALIDPSDGSILGQVVCGDHGGALPPPTVELELAVLASDVFVQFPMDVRGTAGAGYGTARVGLVSTEAGPRLDPESSVRLYNLRERPVELVAGWLGLAQQNETPTRWVAGGVRGKGGSRPSSSPIRGVILADGDTHADLLATPAAAAIGGDVALIGDVAADTATWEILWRLPAVPVLRPVPCLPAVGEAGWLVAGAEDHLALLWTPRGTGSTPQDTARTLVREWEQREADALAQLAQRALVSGDANLVGRLIRSAVERGARTSGSPGRALALAQDGLARLFAGGSARVNQRSVEALIKEEQHLLERLPDELVRTARGTEDGALARALLELLLARDPDHPGAAATVRAMLPADAPLGPDFDASSWLTFLSVSADYPVTFERPAADSSGDVLAERLWKESQAWRRDLVAFRSERLAVIAPPGHAGAVARALAVGELVADVLEELLAPRPDPGADPMILLLYASEEEYRTQSERDGSAPEVSRGWTVGHFDPRDKLSRMFVPAGDPHNQRLLGTFAHELTHHWLATRSPFAARARRAEGGRERPGFWLVEGVANLVGELSFDPAAGTWSANNPRADSLDGVANTPPERRLSWGQLLNLSKDGFDTLSTDRDWKVPLTWQLGVAGERSALNTFYDQAGALAHYLFAAEGGQNRALLFEALAAYYTGTTPVDIAAALGLDPAALGDRVLQYARSVVRQH